MSQRWLVAVDDSIWSYYALHYAAKFMRPDDTLIIANVPEQSSKAYAAFSSAALVNDIESVSEMRCRKVIYDYRCYFFDPCILREFS